jgi:hypothetical protein
MKQIGRWVRVDPLAAAPGARSYSIDGDDDLDLILNAGRAAGLTVDEGEG